MPKKEKKKSPQWTWEKMVKKLRNNINDTSAQIVEHLENDINQLEDEKINVSFTDLRHIITDLCYGILYWFQLETDE